MKEQDIVKLLNSAVDKITPDCYEKITSIDNKKRGEIIDMSQNNSNKKAIAKGYFIGLSTAAAVMLVVACGFMFKSFSQSYVSIDINPSIELQTNGLKKVVSVNGVNDDAKKVLENVSVEGEKLDIAVEKIVDEAIELGYIKDGQKNSILVSVDGKKVKFADKLKKGISDSINNVLDSRVIKADVQTQNIEVDPEKIKQAHEQGVSVGKKSLLDRIVGEDKTITFEEISSVSIAQLMNYAKDKNIKLDDLLDNYEEVLENLEDQGVDEEVLDALEDQFEGADDDDDDDSLETDSDDDDDDDDSSETDSDDDDDDESDDTDSDDDDDDKAWSNSSSSTSTPTSSSLVNNSDQDIDDDTDDSSDNGDDNDND